MAAEKRLLKGIYMSIRVLFVCHGNICRSPMAEYVMKDLVEKAGLAAQFHIESAATSREELGNPVYPPAHQKRLQGIRPAHRHGQSQPPECAAHLRR